ncbi:Membrane transport protein [Flavobacterium limnosediminis JC2902]|uniref:Membrane transport protein n=1 Tax=Flavobacterium limnosediminis JC2902 TaxID=1341181 RepID=V6SIB6_9FLAO|nr:AEC family transporter [Flavobacterium limnosediminis]ESU26326.1 Membrane transport protein [Flavobacterium limnosediminis JC2902]
MENILLIFVCMLLGFLVKKSAAFPPLSYKTLNQFVIYISLPAVALYYIPKLEISSKLLFPLGIAWLGFALSYLFFTGFGKLFGWSKKLTGCLIITAGLGNTSFVGFPVIEAVYGKQGLETAVIVDQPGSFVVVSTLAILVATMYSRGTASSSMILKKILFFPPFIAFAISCVLNVLQLDFPEMLQSVFQRLGSTVTPIALVSVGMQLEFGSKSKHWKFLTLGLFFKLFLTPAFFYLLYVMLLGGTGLEVQVSILEAAMAPMITGVIVASNYGLKPKLSSMMIGFGIPISFITLIFWYFLLQHI